MMHPVLAIALAACAVAQVPAEPSGAQDPLARTDDEELRRRVEAIVEEALQPGEVPGIAIVFGTGEEPLFAQGWGYADASQGVPATADTIFRIGRPAQVFTAVAVMQLVEEGKVSLEDELSKHLPDFPGAERVTIHHLLSQTSGIPGYRELHPDWERRGRRSFTAEELTSPFAGEPFAFEPGERFELSNSGYTLLSLVVGKVSGVEFTERLQRSVFLPLGLRNTSYCEAEAAPEPPAEPAGEPEEGEAPAEAPEVVAAVPAFYLLGEGRALSMEDICTSARDLYRAAQGLADRSILDESSYRRMTEPVQLESGEVTGYGYGFAIADLDGRRCVVQGGTRPGERARVAHYPDDDLVVVIVAASDAAPVEEIEGRVARAALGLDEPGVVDLQLEEAERELFAGTYQIGSTRLRVQPADDGRLRLEWPTGPTLTLLYQGKHSFVAREEPETTLRFEVEDGVATRFFLLREGFESVAKRMG